METFLRSDEGSIVATVGVGSTVVSYNFMDGSDGAVCNSFATPEMITCMCGTNPLYTGHGGMVTGYARLIRWNPRVPSKVWESVCGETPDNDIEHVVESTQNGKPVICTAHVLGDIRVYLAQTGIILSTCKSEAKVSVMGWGSVNWRSIGNGRIKILHSHQESRLAVVRVDGTLERWNVDTWKVGTEEAEAYHPIYSATGEEDDIADQETFEPSCEMGHALYQISQQVADKCRNCGEEIKDGNSNWVCFQCQVQVACGHCVGKLPYPKPCIEMNMGTQDRFLTATSGQGIVCIAQSESYVFTGHIANCRVKQWGASGECLQDTCKLRSDGEGKIVQLLIAGNEILAASDTGRILFMNIENLGLVRTLQVDLVGVTSFAYHPLSSTCILCGLNGTIDIVASDGRSFPLAVGHDIDEAGKIYSSRLISVRGQWVLLVSNNTTPFFAINFGSMVEDSREFPWDQASSPLLRSPESTEQIMPLTAAGYGMPRKQYKARHPKETSYKALCHTTDGAFVFSQFGEKSLVASSVQSAAELVKLSTPSPIMHIKHCYQTDQLWICMAEGRDGSISVLDMKSLEAPIKNDEILNETTGGKDVQLESLRTYTVEQKGLFKISGVPTEVAVSCQQLCAFIFTQPDDKLICLRASGNVEWQVEPDGTIEHLRLVMLDKGGENEILCGVLASGDRRNKLNYIAGFDCKNGRTLWKYSMACPVSIAVQPFPAEYICAQCSGGSLLTLAAKVGKHLNHTNQGEQLRDQVGRSWGSCASYMAFGTHGSNLLFTGQVVCVRVWDLRSGKIIGRKERLESWVSSLIAADKADEHQNNHFYTGLRDGSVVYWSAGTSERGGLQAIWMVVQHTNDVLRLVHSGEYLWSMSALKVVALHRLSMDYRVMSTRRLGAGMIENMEARWYKGWASFLKAAGFMAFNSLQMVNFAYQSVSPPKPVKPAIEWIRHLAMIGIPETVANYQVLFFSVLTCILSFLFVMRFQEFLEWKSFSRPEQAIWRLSSQAVTAYVIVLSGPAVIPVNKVLAEAIVCKDSHIFISPEVDCWGTYHMAYMILPTVLLLIPASAFIYRLVQADFSLQFLEVSWNPFDVSGDIVANQKNRPVTHRLFHRSKNYELVVLATKVCAVWSNVALAPMIFGERSDDRTLFVCICNIFFGACLLIANFAYDQFWNFKFYGISCNALQAAFDAGILWVYVMALANVLAGPRLFWAGPGGMPLAACIGYMLCNRWKNKPKCKHGHHLVQKSEAPDRNLESVQPDPEGGKTPEETSQRCGSCGDEIDGDEGSFCEECQAHFCAICRQEISPLPVANHQDSDALKGFDDELRLERTRSQIVEADMKKKEADNEEELFGAVLLTKEGEKPTREVLANCEAILVQFSGQWCPFCPPFTEQLKELYVSELKELGLEVVFVSSDKDQEAFMDYYAAMPWVALPYARRDLQQKLSERFEVRGIPSTKILGRDCSLLVDNGRNFITNWTPGQEVPWRCHWDDKFGKNLRNGNSLKSTFSQVSGKDKVVLLFSDASQASHDLVHKLTDAYDKLCEKKVLVVYVSHTKDHDEFEHLFLEMRWVAVPFAEYAIRMNLKQSNQVKSLPAGIVLGKDGNELTRDLRQFLTATAGMARRSSQQSLP
eukprot:TRINITY_DN22311_c0_g1_i1.p1 TRINITY_DN22311_c0_g1~~TRINITY_DN22311_c0_g1_i1.p1  ORF type:complete len:1625 (-),score=259.86 TRINITY_DN22311_c0_g1_i1:173-5047(-)